jgi:tetratricopeptide (TPR) repeat protein
LRKLNSITDGRWLSGRRLDPEDPTVAEALNNLGGLLRQTQRLEEAELHYRRALAIREKALGSDHRDVATSLENYTFLLRAMDRPEEAAPLESRARAIRGLRAPD